MDISPVALVGGIGMIAVALGFVGYALVRRLGAAYLALGMLGWVATVAVKFAVAIPLNPPVIAYARSLPQPWQTLVLFLYGGAMTGITEVGIVWLVLRYSRLGNAPWPKVLAFGIGFGAIEAFLLGLGSLTAALAGMYLPEQMPAGVMKQLAEADNLAMQLASISERVFTCLGHLATNVMIFYAVATRRVRWFWAGFAYKSAIDGVATLAIVDKYLATTTAVWVLEGIVVVWGMAGVAVTVWLGRGYPSQPLALDNETPDAFAPKTG